MNSEERKTYAKAYREKNREALRAKDRERSKDPDRMAYNKETSYKRYKSYRDWLTEIKRSSPCIYCGESHPATIHFHHREPEKKFMAVSSMVAGSFSREDILLEIAKCDTVCANCHAKLHWNYGDN